MADYTGIPQTCPIIDEVIDEIETLYLEIEAVPRKDVDRIIRLMEKIRTANSNLRDFGNATAEALDDANSKREELERKIDELKSELINNSKEIESLQNDLYRIEQQ